VDVRKTKKFYAVRNVCDGVSAEEQNFLRNVFLRRESLDKFMGGYGIRPDKVRNLQVMEVDPFLQSVCYTGEYPIEAEIINDDKNEGKSENIGGEWAQTDFGFSFHCREDQTGVFVEFMADLPWLLLPPIEMPRYINKAALPEEWTEWNVWKFIEGGNKRKNVSRKVFNSL